MKGRAKIPKTIKFGTPTAFLLCSLSFLAGFFISTLLSQVAFYFILHRFFPYIHLYTYIYICFVYAGKEIWIDRIRRMSSRAYGPARESLNRSEKTTIRCRTERPETGLFMWFRFRWVCRLAYLSELLILILDRLFCWFKNNEKKKKGSI